MRYQLHETGAFWDLIPETEPVAIADMARRADMRDRCQQAPVTTYSGPPRRPWPHPQPYPFKPTPPPLPERRTIGTEDGGMRVLVACEFSQIVCGMFRARGHSAWSCDILPTEGCPEFHFETDVRELLHLNWDLMIAHPPCTHLAVSGARWFRDKQEEQAEALAFVRLLMDAPIPRIALENPVSIISSRIRKPDQIIQPWQFGHGETKATCLWLKNLPLLTPTDIVAGRENRVHRMPPGPNRWKERSRTLPGIAEAMADQWGGPVVADERETP